MFSKTDKVVPIDEPPAAASAAALITTTASLDGPEPTITEPPTSNVTAVVTHEHHTKLVGPEPEVEPLADDGRLSEGAHVQVRYKQGAKWVPARITMVREDGTYDVKYSNKEVEAQVAPGLIRSLQPTSPGDLSVGQQVFVWPTDGAHQVLGRVTRIQYSGLIDVVFHDGSRGDALPVSNFHFVPDGEGGVCKGGHYGVGQSVEATYPSVKKTAMGKIIRIHDNGSYDVRFNDGTEDVFVFPEDIHGDHAKSDKAHPDAFKEGQEIEAKLGVNSTWYKGKIIGIHPNGTYDVLFDDGDKQLGMATELIRTPKAHATFAGEDGASHQLFKEGQEVESRHRGQAQYLHAHIVRVNKDGTYDVVYDGAEVESCVPVDCIRASSYKRVHDGEIFEGAKVEARFKNGLLYLPGTVMAIHHASGTYDIDYDHGQKETEVPRSHIRVLHPVHIHHSPQEPSPTPSRHGEHKVVRRPTGHPGSNGGDNDGASDCIDEDPEPNEEAAK